MQTGTKISVAGHGLLITWALVGGWLNPEPLPFQSQDVSIISAEEFARLSEQQAAPEVADEPVAPQEPAVTESTPAIPERPTPTPESPMQPEPIETPAEDAEAEPPAPEPVPEVPSIVPDAPDVPEIVTDLPQTAEPETAQQTDRVAPEPVRPPEPDTQISDVVQEEVAPDAGAEANQPVQEATAPEAASDRIVTEAEADDAEPTAPLASVRPRTRPNRPQPQPEAETQTAAREEETTPSPEPNPEVESSAVDDALAEALAGSGEVEAPEPSGPPMTRGEKDALRVAVSQCWNVGSLSSEALRTSVVVGVTLSREGMPDIGSIRMLSSSGGSDSSAKQAYEAARRAIIRCGSRGFDLPADKYAQWRDIEMTFNPEGMRIR
ncbi:energy transducer TonB [Tritonibacter mobilis]|uniref:energy transducer TonB n=1 Tax=Tritonibacter mobilis TaxID=379347 RepID=UPI00140251EC|nr:energy transducer TonB [Tritonibacter mobilis]NHM19756.1 energy transducer TonB [Tritonibacter mobilis]NHM23905.1 energy transducer TonB [Tritonibacter mobilis]